VSRRPPVVGSVRLRRPLRTGRSRRRRARVVLSQRPEDRMGDPLRPRCRRGDPPGVKGRVMFARMIAPMIVATFLVVSTCAAQSANDWLVQAAAAWKNGENDKAFEFADKAIAADPESKKGYLFRAALRESDPGKDLAAGLREALADYTKVLKIDPKDIDAL